jgi:hypothetical protein
MSDSGAAMGETEFSALAAALRDFKAGPLSGVPSDRALARAAGVSPTTIGNWLGGTQFPQDVDKILIVVRAVATTAKERSITGQASGATALLDAERWREAHHKEARRRAGVVSAGVQRRQAILALSRSSARSPLSEVDDPFALEVHRPIQPDDPPPGLPMLPTYVRREHDLELERVVRRAAEGSSGIAVLVGGSSTGKTRACWEALRLLRNLPEQWQLWHPIDPTRPDAALRDLPAIGPRTVMWMNEAQFYLEAADGGLGEQVAAGLRELLRSPARAPVLVLATLWPQFWDGLTGRPADGTDPHAQARELLAGRDITVPAAFTAAQLQQLREIEDVRLDAAAAYAQDGHVIQFLAGVPELLTRYRNAPPAAAALIHTAMDARRLGMRVGLPSPFLEAAAPEYLTDNEWDVLGEDWLEQALAYTAVPCKGIRGPLTRMRPRPIRPRLAGPGSRYSYEQMASQLAGPLYRLADYLDQHGRAYRNSQMPPAGFWSAAADHASPGDQATLGDAAHDRGLYRAAAQLHKNAAARGNLRAAAYLSNPPPCLHADARPASWAAAHVALDDLIGVDLLLDELWGAGLQEQATALAERAAAKAPLDNSFGVARLLGRLRATGLEDQAIALAERAAAKVPLDNPFGVDFLLDELWGAGLQEQATALGERAAAKVPLDDPSEVARLLDRLCGAGVQEQATALAERAAAKVPLDDPSGVAWLLRRLGEAGLREQAIALAQRAAAHTALDNPRGVAELLGSLQAAGLQEQAATLLGRDPSVHVLLDNLSGTAFLLDELSGAGLREQAIALAQRATHTALDDPRGVAQLLGSLLAAGLREQAATLAQRAAAHTALDNPRGVAWLLYRLWGAGLQEQATTLAQRAAAHTALDHPRAVGQLLSSLLAAGLREQATTLAQRAAGHTALDDPSGVAWLLYRLWGAGLQEQATTLLRRDPAAQAALDDARSVAELLGSLRAAGLLEQATTLAGRAAAHVALDDPRGVAQLLDSLRAAGLQGQATALTNRLPAAGMFELFCEVQGRQHQFRYGRQPDGAPAGPWSWEDLD